MTDPTRGSDRAGRRSKRFLTPLQILVVITPSRN